MLPRWAQRQAATRSKLKLCQRDLSNPGCPPNLQLPRQLVPRPVFEDSLSACCFAHIPSPRQPLTCSPAACLPISHTCPQAEPV